MSTLFIGLGACFCMASALAANSFEVVGYYANWTSLPFTAVPVKNLTILNYAFASLEADGSIKLLGNKDDENFKKISELKKQQAKLRVVLSVGGWTLSKAFSSVAASARLTQKFADNIADLMQRYPGLDGIDIDWEFPVAGGDGIAHSYQDKQNYVLMLKAIREKLDSLGDKHYLITIAAPSHANRPDGGSVDNLAVKEMLHYIDYINIMDYDIHQSTSEPNQTNNDAALFQSPNNPASNDSVQDSINDFKKQGLTATEIKQLVMGIPLYGFAWREVTPSQAEPAHPGLYSPAQGKLANPYVQGSDGVFAYTDIVNRLIADQKLQGAFSEQYKFATYYSPTTKAFVSFDDVQTVQAKAAYIKQNELGGAMFWEVSQDSFDKNSLIYNTCLALGENECAVPTALPSEKMKLELTNNDPNRGITITLVTEEGSYYAFPALNAGASVVYNDKTSLNVEQLLGKYNLRILLTTASGEQRWCSGWLSMPNNSYHHIQVYYDNKPNCLLQ